jgi:hypothetical protein
LTRSKAIKAEIGQKQEQELLEGLRRARLILSKIPDQEIVRAVRESRNQR